MNRFLLYDKNINFIKNVALIYCTRMKRGYQSMECQIGVISGDGIGPEIVTEAKKVLDQIGKKYGHNFN